MFVNAGEVIIVGDDGKNAHWLHLYCITKSTGTIRGTGNTCNTRNMSYPRDNGKISLRYH